MKLFVFVALVAAASAGRLEHLERSYLPPVNHVHSENGFGSGNGRFGNGQSSNIFGSNGQDSVIIDSNDHSSSFHSNGFGASLSSGSNGLSRNAGFGSVSNQYLPPNHGPSGSSSFGAHQFGSHSGSHSLGSNGFGSLSGSRSFGSQPQFGAASRQYLAPKHSSSQQPQQPFDVNSGYIY